MNDEIVWELKALNANMERLNKIMQAILERGTESE